MLISEIITELFKGTAAPRSEDHWEVTHDTDVETVWEFDVGDRHYEASASIMRGFPGIYYVEFGLKTPHGLTRWGIEKTGGSFRVLELMIPGLAHVRQHHKVHGWYFSAMEPSRARLYARLANHAAQQLGWVVRRDLAQEIDPRVADATFLVIDPAYVPELETLLKNK